MTHLPRANMVLLEIKDRVLRNAASAHPVIRGRISETLARRLVKEDLGIDVSEDEWEEGKEAIKVTGNPEVDTFDFYGVWLVVVKSDHDWAAMWECVGEMENVY